MKIQSLEKSIISHHPGNNHYADNSFNPNDSAAQEFSSEIRQVRDSKRTVSAHASATSNGGSEFAMARSESGKKPVAVSSKGGNASASSGGERVTSRGGQTSTGKSHFLDELMQRIKVLIKQINQLQG